jgi:hypothetical protein
MPLSACVNSMAIERYEVRLETRRDATSQGCALQQICHASVSPVMTLSLPKPRQSVHMGDTEVIHAE